MEQPGKKLRPMKDALTLQLVDTAAGRAIALLLRHDAIVEMYDGPWPGVAMLPAEARNLAELLLRLAEDAARANARTEGSADSSDPE